MTPDAPPEKKPSKRPGAHRPSILTRQPGHLAETGGNQGTALEQRTLVRAIEQSPFSFCGFCCCFPRVF
jgi:hypothetical protein